MDASIADLLPSPPSLMLRSTLFGDRLSPNERRVYRRGRLVDEITICASFSRRLAHSVIFIPA